MDTSTLNKFAQVTRTNLQEQVSEKIKFVLALESQARIEFPKSVKDLEFTIRREGKPQVVERIAYMWFNYFCTLRFMDMNGYSKIKVVSPHKGQTQPEILAKAKQGIIPPSIPLKTKEKILDLLNESLPSNDQDNEIYRMLLVPYCIDLFQSMPFVFQQIDDYAELLLPDDLLSQKSVLADTQNVMTAKICENVEVIGWLYQFYISEQKQQVQHSKERYVPQKIPAATQLFTPNWIVRYLVENSLGRLWMLNNPQSKLIDKMKYYLKPGEPESAFIKISSPEEIKVCDPACGSGHILTYVFDLLYDIYEEEGYSTSEIPQKILSNNIFGIEIDQKVGSLANFALIMKACSKYHQFFTKNITTNICVLNNVTFSDQELNKYIDTIGIDVFNKSLKNGLKDFEHANNFGSLIQPRIRNFDSIYEWLDKETLDGNSHLANTHSRVQTVLEQSKFLSQRYHVVVANPPYMGSQWMNETLTRFAKKNFPNSKSHMSSMFIERNLRLTVHRGYSSMITMQSWMFLASNEGVRDLILNTKTILSLAHLGTKAFDSIDGEVVSTVAFIIQNESQKDYKGDYLRLIDGDSEKSKLSALQAAIQNPSCGWLYQTSANDFKKIPGNPIAYWVSNTFRDCFEKLPLLEQYASAVCGMTTGENAKFVRQWYEVSINRTELKATSRTKALQSQKKWFPYAKGGQFRKWYGNADNIVNWENDGFDIQHSERSYVRARTKYFKPSVSWSFISSSYFGVRQQPAGFIFDMAGCSLFPNSEEDFEIYTGALCAKTALAFLKAMNPTLNFQVRNVGSIPLPTSISKDNIKKIVTSTINTSRQDWNSYETSWDFSILPLLSQKHRQPTLQETYVKLRKHWSNTTLKMQRLEEENNRIFIEAYGLKEELTSNVPLTEITLTCNPYYRYAKSYEKTQTGLEALLLSDTMKEFVSYSVGCMFGRYSIKKPGLILANQGETFEDFVQKVPNSLFQVNKDNILPILDIEWFNDDIVALFKNFIKVTFGEEHHTENLKFIENALNIKNKKKYTIRDYFNKDFYKDHCQTYKKRPIYWLFSSPKGSFQALIYMHRYNKETISVILNDYLRELQTNLKTRKTLLENIINKADSSKKMKTKARKETACIYEIITDLQDYEKNVLLPLAEQQIEIDLDDGVKANYAKFGQALRTI